MFHNLVSHLSISPFVVFFIAFPLFSSLAEVVEIKLRLAAPPGLRTLSVAVSESTSWWSHVNSTLCPQGLNIDSFPFFPLALNTFHPQAPPLSFFAPLFPVLHGTTALAYIIGVWTCVETSLISLHLFFYLLLELTLN